MKYDLVIMNPPYNQGMWFKFLEKAAELSDIVASVNPDPLDRVRFIEKVSDNKALSQKFKDYCVNNGLQHRIPATHHFPSIISGKISAFVFDQNKEYNPEVLDGDPLVDILSKVILDQFVAEVHQGRTRHEPGGGTLCVANCVRDGLTVENTAEPDREKFKGDYFIVNRFFGFNASSPVYRINMTDKALSGNCIAYRTAKGETVDGFKSVYLSTLYRAAIKFLKGGYNNVDPMHLKMLPRLDLSRVWTDAEVSQHFKLTQSEIEVIEDYVG